MPFRFGLPDASVGPPPRALSSLVGFGLQLPLPSVLLQGRSRQLPQVSSLSRGVWYPLAVSETGTLLPSLLRLLPRAFARAQPLNTLWLWGLMLRRNWRRISLTILHWPTLGWFRQHSPSEDISLLECFMSEFARASADARRSFHAMKRQQGFLLRWGGGARFCSSPKRLSPGLVNLGLRFRVNLSAKRVSLPFKVVYLP